MENKYQKFAKLVREARERAGLTQQEVADALGITKGMVSIYEQGASMPPFPRLVVLCRHLDIDINSVAEAA